MRKEQRKEKKGIETTHECETEKEEAEKVEGRYSEAGRETVGKGRRIM